MARRKTRVKSKKVKVTLAKNKEYLSKMFVYSILAGVVITMLTGVYLIPGIVGANLRGYPLAWLAQPILPPQYQMQCSMVWPSLFLDVALWSFISFLVLIIVYRRK